MRGGRERVGDDVATMRAKLGAAKVKRLTLPFGAPSRNTSVGKDHEHEHYIRELPLAEAGLGCALWDGGLVLSRWIYDHGPQIFADAVVLELGCGVGLAGILAARWARRVVLTDYIESTVVNAAYNVRLNSSTAGERDAKEGGQRLEMAAGALTDDLDRRCPDTTSTTNHYRGNVESVVECVVLDWDVACQEIEEQRSLMSQAATTPSGSRVAAAPPTPTSEERVAAPSIDGRVVCSRLASGRGMALRGTHATQHWYRCLTCWPSDAGCGVCDACATLCHAGHDLADGGVCRFLCDCHGAHPHTSTGAAITAAAAESGVAIASPSAPPPAWTCRAQPRQLDVLRGTFDIIIGAELTYNLLSCHSLARVVNHYLAPDGVFYEVLSDDRDGMSVFVEEIERLGFFTTRRPVPVRYTSHFGTRKWSRQQDETYSFYTWRRKSAVSGGSSTSSKFPDMA